jgi:hypothetical protein
MVDAIANRSAAESYNDFPLGPPLPKKKKPLVAQTENTGDSFNKLQSPSPSKI